MDCNYYDCDKTSPQNHLLYLTEIEFRELEDLYQDLSKFSNIVIIILLNRCKI
ncbi:Uncharacterised protein [Streptococcus dysgalactiae subsp. equisimilis]|uniref:Uncharacterized protein n=1 Tax=Streptococcus dysgalactiae subsp. equisimilis TaxID=119602 RepID=A0AAE9U4K9_STREQ|nr:Uncharacterised protein [Streptococcus dysgalactiae subsp. equisimilis]VTT17478.1 Uncharacterised protein [Streptococcus dysgalactiae]VTT23284.1 Uncharacterised protein [Streptococcus dysgalactiae subsp. equisimilis]